MNTIARSVPIALLISICGCKSDMHSDMRPQPTATLHTTRGDIEVALDRTSAPITVDNFCVRARRGDYDNTIFHRVVPGFVVQGGGWTPDLRECAQVDAAGGRPDVPIKNEWNNGLKNVRGTIAMARDEQPDSATREFYFNLADNQRLDTARPMTGYAGYAVFGHVVHGMDVIDSIAAMPTHAVPTPGVTDGSMENVPVDPVIIKSVSVSR